MGNHLLRESQAGSRTFRGLLAAVGLLAVSAVTIVAPGGLARSVSRQGMIVWSGGYTLPLAAEPVRAAVVGRPIGFPFGFDENPKPGNEGTTTSKASSAEPP